MEALKVVINTADGKKFRMDKSDALDIALIRNKLTLSESKTLDTYYLYSIAVSNI